MDRVIAPHRRTMKDAVDPVHHEVGRRPGRWPPAATTAIAPAGRGRRRRTRSVLRRGDAEQQRGAEHQEPDAQIAREQRDDEPVAEIGDELALAPPRAGPDCRPRRCASTENTSASAIVTGTTLARVWPSISMISVGRFISTGVPNSPAARDGVWTRRLKAGRISCPCERAARRSRRHRRAASHRYDRAGRPPGCAASAARHRCPIS